MNLKVNSTTQKTPDPTDEIFFLQIENIAKTKFENSFEILQIIPNTIWHWIHTMMLLEAKYNNPILPSAPALILNGNGLRYLRLDIDLYTPVS